MADTKISQVSVIIPTYGRPEYLNQAIQSVADQTYRAVELILVDDHSPEPVEHLVDDAVIESVASVEIIRHKQNRGANAARCTGIKAASGKIVAFLDDDDTWYPTYLERVIEAFDEGGPEIGVVMAGEQVVNEHNIRIGSDIPVCAGDILKEILQGTVRTATFSRFAVRQSIIESAGMPDDRFPSWQDKEWHIRLSQYCQYESVSEILVTRRIADHDQITDDFEGKRDVSYRLLLAKHRELAAEFGRQTEQKFLASLTQTVGFSALRNGYYAQSLKYLFRAITYDPTVPATYLYFLLALGGPLTYEPAKRLNHMIAGTTN
jgi:glycosyltransferase involved in cell wall biosynthesis